jgi:hypothetical protein
MDPQYPRSYNQLTASSSASPMDVRYPVKNLGEIRFLLNTWLDEIPRDAPFPIFNKTNLAYGKIYVECADGTSVNWICSVIPKIVTN